MDYLNPQYALRISSTHVKQIDRKEFLKHAIQAFTSEGLSSSKKRSIRYE
jgi:hypothetical protein